MAYVAVDKNRTEWVFDVKPIRVKTHGEWQVDKELACINPQYIQLPKGSIEALIDRKLTWEDDCVELP